MLHYARWQRNGDPTKLVRRTSGGIKGDDEARFWHYTERRGPDECWPWTGTTTEKGYGLLNSGSKKVRAHRFVYELLVGPIPDGAEVDHVWSRGCRSKGCVNPAHLEAVTKAENTRRISDKETCRNGHPWSEYAYVRPNGRGRSCAECARQVRRAKAAKEAQLHLSPPR